MKLFFYCGKSKPYLVYHREYCALSPTEYIEYGYETRWEDKSMLEGICNGNIVAECNYEIEPIFVEEYYVGCGFEYEYYLDDENKFKGLHDKNHIYRESCLTQYEMQNYLGKGFGGDRIGWAIHIKNLHIFDYPKELSDFEYISDLNGYVARAVLFDAPKNAQKIIANGINAILLLRKSEELGRILNGEQTVIVLKHLPRALKGDD